MNYLFTLPCLLILLLLSLTPIVHPIDCSSPCSASQYCGSDGSTCVGCTDQNCDTCGSKTDAPDKDGGVCTLCNAGHCLNEEDKSCIALTTGGGFNMCRDNPSGKCKILTPAICRHSTSKVCLNSDLDNCQECGTDGTTCSRCTSQFCLHSADNNCRNVSDDNELYSKDDTTKACVAEGTTMKNCFESTSNVCTTCESGYCLQDGACLHAQELVDICITSEGNNACTKISKDLGTSICKGNTDNLCVDYSSTTSINDCAVCTTEPDDSTTPATTKYYCDHCYPNYCLERTSGKCVSLAANASLCLYSDYCHTLEKGDRVCRHATTYHCTSEYANDHILEGCAQCSSDSICTICEEGYVLTETKCLKIPEAEEEESAIQDDLQGRLTTGIGLMLILNLYII